MTIVHGIIGCGQVAVNHVDGFRAVPDCEVRWACDRDGARLAAFVDAHGMPRSTDSHRDVLADREITSVSVGVDHAQHATLAAAALQAGKDVLVEKPLALSLADGAHLCRLADERGRVLGVVAQHRHDPLIAAVKRWVEHGLLGDLVLLAAVLQCRREPAYYRSSYWRGTWDSEGGSVLINQAYHCVDLLRWLGGAVVGAKASMATRGLAGVVETEDTFCGVLELAGGALATVAATLVSSVFMRTRIDLVGTRGSVTFDLDHPDRLHFSHGTPELRREVEAVLAARAKEPPPPDGLDVYTVSHRRQVADFCDAVRERRRPLVDGAEGLATLEAIESLYRAGRAAC